MSSLPILLKGDSILQTRAEPVNWDAVDRKDLQKLIQDMIKTCKLSRGVGLAAPQVGRSIRLFVTYWKYPLVWINPILIPTGELLPPFPEQCLSIPGISVPVSRYKNVTVAYQDMHGNPFVEHLDGTMAVIVQHEIDHLNGVLITDYLSGEHDDSTDTAG